MLLFALACTPTPESTAPYAQPDEPGPYKVGVETIEFVDSRGKALVAELWYPASPHPDDTPDPYPEIPISLDAHRGAAVDLRGAPYPLIAFSHGMGGIRYQSAYLLEDLASHGYVSIAVDHPHNTFLDLDEDRMVEVFLERPGDVIHTVDALHELVRSEPAFAGLVDPDAGYTMMGHSFGAWTALVVGGGAVDLQALADHCAAGDEGVACRYLGDIDPADVAMAESADPRVRLTVPLSPGVWYGFGPAGEGLEAVTRPIAFGGDRDTVLDYEGEILPTYAAMSGPKRLGVLAGGGHYAFTDICLIAAPLFDDCEEEDAGFISMERAHAISKVVINAALDLEIQGRADAARFLEPDWASENAPELSWQDEL